MTQKPPADGTKIISGRPHTFGWLRRPELDTASTNIWEKPDGGLVAFHKSNRHPLVFRFIESPLIMKKTL